MTLTTNDGSLAVLLDATEAADWVMGAVSLKSKIERLARVKGKAISVRASIGASLGIIWPDGRESNLPDDRLKEQVRQQFKEEQSHGKLDSE